MAYFFRRDGILGLVPIGQVQAPFLTAEHPGAPGNLPEYR